MNVDVQLIRCFFLECQGFEVNSFCFLHRRSSHRRRKRETGKDQKEDEEKGKFLLCYYD